MAWNAPHNPPNHAHPPPPYGNNQGFWEFMRSLNLNAGSPEAGAGIDHTMPSPPPGFFPFGPSGGAGPDSFNPSFGGWGHGGRHGRRHGPGVNNNDEGSDTDHHHRHGRRGSRHGRGGRGGRHGRHNHEFHTPSETEEDLYDITAAAGAAESELFDSFDNEKQTTSTSTLRDDNTAGEHPDPPEEIPTSSSCPPGGRRGRRGGFGGRCGRGRHAFPRHFPSPPHHGGPHHPPHHGGAHFPPPPPPFGGPFGGWGGFPGGPPGGPRPHRGGPGRGSVDLTGIMNNLASYMRDYWQNYRRGQQQAQGAGVDTAGDDAFVDEETFTPPADIFSTPTGWTIHLAIPGAKKQDVAVHWDADNSVLVVSGIVHRPGDEQFLSGMVSGERRVGLFERKIELPPAAGEGQEKDEVDGNRITAKLEDGVLVVVVGKVEKEWTEVRKVDVE